MIACPGFRGRARPELNYGVGEELRRELLARRDDDQRIRTLVHRGWGQCTAMPAEVAAQWQRIDEDNTRWLADVVSARGWPGRALAGEDGAAAAWLLAQHADRDPARQQRFLDALRRAAGRGKPPCRIWRTWRTGSGSMPGIRSGTAPSSSKPTANSGRAPSRIRTGWTSAAGKPDWNRSPTTKPACAPSHNRRRLRNANATRQNALTCRW
jgi:hypothetical protein